MSERLSFISESTPLLEKALHAEESPGFAPELQLRGSVCGLATAALQFYVHHRYGVMLDRRLTVPKKAPRGLNARLLRHVGLFDSDCLIDPSYSQFFSYVGLSRTVVRQRPELATLFPVEKIALIPKATAASFADDMAMQMHAIEPELVRRRDPTVAAYPPENSLVGSSLDEKREVLRDIWDPDGYDMQFPLEGQSDSFQKRALHLVMRMNELERT